MLRHAIFVLVLVGAAFAGGAAINGPGLAWLQRNLIGGPTIIVDGTVPPGGEPGRPTSKRFPSATSPALPFAIAPPTPAEGTSPPNPPAASIQMAAAAPTRPGATSLGLAEPVGPADASAPLLTATNAAPADLPPLDLPTEAPIAPPALAAANAKTDPVARLASTRGQDPAPAPALAPALSPAAQAGPGRDWTEIRQRLKTLGVARYAVDADLDGRVRFSCVIPMDGLRAVGHHFEADGDDEWQAIDATIRRITLWRATEPTRPEP